MFVPLRGTSTWRFHTELCKFQTNVSANNSTTEYRTDLKLREVVLLCIFYNITNSWLLSFTGFDFKILWRDSENQEFKLTSIQKVLHGSIFSLFNLIYGVCIKRQINATSFFKLSPQVTLQYLSMKFRIVAIEMKSLQQ